MTPEQWLSKQIKEKGIKQVFISQKTGIPENALSASLCGRRHIKVAEFLAVCAVADIDPLKCPTTVATGEANA